ncbi:MAG TPA: helix-turn-helix transcriptional regulator [Puia sp.]|jgi:transcriptional regulator with XRE-family HTH domain
MNHFATNITHLRKQQNKTQKDVARGLSVDVKRYQAWEEGRATPQLSMASRICEYYQFYDLYSMITKNIT